MDDLLPGVIIDAVLGIDMNETLVFKGQLNDIMYYNSNDPEELKRVKREVHFTYNNRKLYLVPFWSSVQVTIGFTGFVIKHGRFSYLEDTYG